MFCEKCGKQLDEGAKFCNNCGARVDKTGNIGTEEQNNTFVKNSGVFLDMHSKSGSGVNSSKELLSSLVLISGVLQTILIMLWFVKGTVSVYGAGYSLHDLFFEGRILSLLHVVLMIISAVTLFMPFVKNNAEKRRRLIYQKVIAIISILWVLLMASLTAAGSYGATMGFTGWILFMGCITLTVLLFVISSQSKKYSRPGK